MDTPKDKKVLSFPAGFKWGTATASYQIEGGWEERGWNIWDAFCHAQGRVINDDNGNVACDHFHRFEEDVQIMKDLGLKHYRLSLSWARIQPTGHGPTSEKGLAFYDRLIDCLLAAGIDPCITLYHWDLPLALQIEHGGWHGAETYRLFVEYARICFQRYGDRVKSWLTFNEPWCSAVLGYGNGEHAPGLTSPDGSGVYLAGHNLLLAHAHTVALYREQFQSNQGGSIGITLNANWSEPKASEDPNVASHNAEAGERSMLWNLGWFADPVYFGDYPEVMKKRCGERLPSFTDGEKKLLKGSSDFFGLNHYSSDLAEDDSGPGRYVSHWGTVNSGGYWGDMAVKSSADPAWEQTDMGWSIVPWGFKKLLLWIQKRYSPTGGILVTENGCAVHEPSVEVGVADEPRVKYFESYVSAMHSAMEEGADVRGYYAWSFMDNFEWAFGYSKRFGIVYVDYNTLKRTTKSSALWYKEVMATNELWCKHA
ncbi:unnamed protein product [Discosporangium mesarthrocarpum]